MLGMSASFLIIGFVTRYIVFEIVSIAAFLLGTAFTFKSMESYVKSTPANRAVVSPLKGVANLLSDLGVNGKVAYIPASSSNSVVAFVSRDPNASAIPVEAAVGEVSADGVAMTPLSEDLVRLYDEELDGIKGKDVDYLSIWIPKVIVDGLGLVSKVKIEKKGEEAFSYVFERPIFKELCSEFLNHGQSEQICGRIGCPFSASVPHSFAQALGKVVYFEGCTYDAAKQHAKGSFRIGPSVESPSEQVSSR